MDRIVFMGTPEFAAAHFTALLDAGHRVVGALTQPDRPKGRGRKVFPGPVKEIAVKRGIPLLQPYSFKKEPEAIEWVKNLNPEILIVVAYGLILPQTLLDIPPLGAWNVHGSLLPKYRGAAPIRWAILDGETKTGVTLIQMDAGMDTGDILLAEETEIGPEETYGELRDRLIALGVNTLLLGLKLAAEGKITRTPQDHSKATIARMIKKEDRDIDWNDSAINIHNKIRGFNPEPGAKSGELKLLRSRVATQSFSETSPGKIIEVSRYGITVGAGEGAVIITEVQPPGGKPMAASDYAHGHNLHVGGKF